MSWAHYKWLKVAVDYRSKTEREVLVGEQFEYVPVRAPFNGSYGCAKMRGEPRMGFGACRCVILNGGEETL